MSRNAINKETSCDGKIKYASLKEASKVASSFNQRSKNKRRLESYCCCFCSNYHVGHSEYKREIKKVDKIKRDKKKINPNSINYHVDITEGFCKIKTFV